MATLFRDGPRPAVWLSGPRRHPRRMRAGHHQRVAGGSQRRPVVTITERDWHGWLGGPPSSRKTPTRRVSAGSLQVMAGAPDRPVLFSLSVLCAAGYHPGVRRNRIRKCDLPGCPVARFGRRVRGAVGCCPGRNGRAGRSPRAWAGGAAPARWRRGPGTGCRRCGRRGAHGPVRTMYAE